MIDQSLHRSKIVKMRARDVRIHPTAQRDLVPAKLKSLIEGGLNLDAIGVIYAVEYSIDNVFGTWIIDGQHRIKILNDLDFGDWLVDVKVLIDVTDDAGASALFLALNAKATVCPYGKFVQKVRSNDPAAVGVTRVTTSRELKVAKTSADGNINCVTTLCKVYGIDQGQTLGKALDILIEAFGRGTPAMEGRIIDGLSIFLSTYNDSVDRASLIKKLAKHKGGPSGLLGRARALTDVRKMSISRAIAEGIVDLYNNGLRSGRLSPL